MMAPVPVSLSDLLNEGWTIVTSSAPLLFTLRRDNKWVMCAADDGSADGHGPTSACVSLN
jgi:hypothetical protein